MTQQARCECCSAACVFHETRREPRPGEEKQSQVNACSVHRRSLRRASTAATPHETYVSFCGSQRKIAHGIGNFLVGACIIGSRGETPGAKGPADTKNRAFEGKNQRTVAWTHRRGSAQLVCLHCVDSDDSECGIVAPCPALPHAVLSMPEVQNHLQRLAAATRWAYGAAAQSSAEPAAWAALALAAHGLTDAALGPARWLASIQQPSGAVGVSAAQDEPRWPTGLAMLAWSAVDRLGGTSAFKGNIQRAAAWSLEARGETGPRSPMIGHDTTLVGWSWAADTHSWLEPTSFFTMGLTAAGYGSHPRTVEGRRLVLDRLLPAGGANYGNTIVLGQQLLPHVQPSGVAMLALAGQSANDSRIERTLSFLEACAAAETAPASLSFACLGLAAHRRRPPAADGWLDAAFLRDAETPLAEYERALLLLAAQPRLKWLAMESGAPAGALLPGDRPRPGAHDVGFARAGRMR